MSNDKERNANLHDRARSLAGNLASLAAEAAAADPALRARLDAALRALEQSAPAQRNTALLENPSDARALVRDVVAVELERYWLRRFGRTP